MLRTMKIQEVNNHILCVLCGGYLVDATTIVECLHSFCRSCIVKYLQTSFYCPVCDVEVHKTKPLLHISYLDSRYKQHEISNYKKKLTPDRTLQDIVYKLVPGLYQGELKLRHDFEEKQREKDIPTEEKQTKTVTKDTKQVEMEDPVCITLECYRRKRNWMDKEIFPTRYLRCPSAVTVNVLKKFLVVKFAIPNTHQIEIIRCDEILQGHLTMTEVSRIYGLYAKSFLDLEYAFLEVTTEEPTKLESQIRYVTPQERITKKKKRKLETCELKPKLPTNGETFEPVCKLATISECDSETLSENGILTAYPDTPPSFSDGTSPKPIQSPHDVT